MRAPLLLQIAKFEMERVKLMRRQLVDAGNAIAAHKPAQVLQPRAALRCVGVGVPDLGGEQRLDCWDISAGRGGVAIGYGRRRGLQRLNRSGYRRGRWRVMLYSRGVMLDRRGKRGGWRGLGAEQTNGRGLRRARQLQVWHGANEVGQFRQAVKY